MSNVPFAAQMEELAAYMASKISVPTIGIGGGYAPIGTTSLILGSIPPQDYLSCDGTVYNIADYPQLAAYIESQFGSKNYFGGNGTTTFGVPTITSSVTGTIYCIKAVVAGEVYSTEERVVGTWIDGKKIYQKVVEISNPSGSWVDIPLSPYITNADIVILQGFYMDRSDVDLGADYYYTNTDRLSVAPVKTNNGWVLLINSATSSTSTINKIAVILKYTKTT